MSSFSIAVRSVCLAWFLFSTIAPCSASEPATPKRQGEEAPLPLGAIARLGSLRLRHASEVNSIAFSPDGKNIASVSHAGERIHVWNTFTGRLLHEIDAPGIFAGAIHAESDPILAFAPDGKAIAAGVQGDVCFWELSSGREVCRFRSQGKGIVALTMASDQKIFYCSGSDNRLYQVDIATGQQQRSWDYFEGKPPRIYPNGFAEKRAILKAVTPDGKTAVWLVERWTAEGSSVSRDGWQLMLWDVISGKDRCPLTDSNDKNFFNATVVLSPDGKYLTVYTQNLAMTVWDATTGKKLKTLSKHMVETVAFSPDCRHVAAIARWTDRSLRMWDLHSGKELWHHDLPRVGSEKPLAFSPDGKVLALAHSKNVHLWNVETAKEILSLEGHRLPVRDLVFSPKGGALISTDAAVRCEWNQAWRQTSREPLRHSRWELVACCGIP